jgi:hypothetical protein
MLERSTTHQFVPGGIRTPNLLIRSQKLYPVELQALLRTDGDTRLLNRRKPPFTVTILTSAGADQNARDKPA